MVIGAATDYVIGEAFGAFGWNKDYQDEASMALSLVVNKGNPTKVAVSNSFKSVSKNQLKNWGIKDI